MAVTDFIFKIDTTKAGSTNSNQYLLNLVGTPDCTVFWGDGSNHYFSSAADAAKTHTYASEGVYTITVTGNICHVSFGSGFFTGDEDKLIEISQWGSINGVSLFGNLNGETFLGCHNLIVTATDIPNSTDIEFLGNLFRSCSSLVTVPNMKNWDLSNLIPVGSGTNFNSMFDGCSSLISLDLDGGYWAIITPQLSDNNRTFYNCTSLTDLKVGTWRMNPTSPNVIENQFINCPLDRASYDAILIGWSQGGLPPNMTLDANLSYYTTGGAAEAGRNTIVAAITAVNDAGGLAGAPTTSYNITPTSNDYAQLWTGQTDPSFSVVINNTGNDSLNFTFTNPTNFYSEINSIGLVGGSSKIVRVFASVLNVGIHNENVIFNNSVVGNTNFNGISEILSQPVSFTYTINPTSNNFGTIEKNNPELSTTFNVVNTGTGTLNFTVQNTTNFYTNTTSFQILSGGNTNVTIFAKTINTGSHNENIRLVESNAGDKFFNCTSNIIDSTPVLSYVVTPLSNDFGTLNQNSTEPEFVVNIANTGNVGLDFTVVNPSEFYLSTNVFSLNGGSNINLIAKAKTDVLGVHSQPILIEQALTNDTNFVCSSEIVNFPTNDVRIFSESKDWGDVDSGDFSIDYSQTFQFINNTNADVNFQYSPNPTYFQIVNNPSPIIVPANSSKDVSIAPLIQSTNGIINEIITFKPFGYSDIPISLTRNLDFSTNSFKILTPVFKDFGVLEKDSAQPSQIITIENTNLGSSNFTISTGVNFTTDLGTGTLIIAGNGTGQIVVQALTTNIGYHEEDLIITQSASGGVQPFTVISNIVEPPFVPPVTPPEYSITPPSHDFGNLGFGDLLNLVTFPVIQNNTANSYNFTASDSLNFTITPSTFTLNPNGGQLLTVKAKTDNLGLHNEFLLLESPTVGNAVFSASSNVIVPTYTYTVSPSQYDFGEIPLGFPAVTKEFLIENTGNLDLILNISLNGDFLISDTQITINPNQIIPITVTATTDSIGLQAGFFRIEDANLQAPTTDTNLTKFITVIPVSGLTTHYEEFVNSGVNMYGLPDQTNITQWDDLSGNFNHANWINIPNYESPDFVTNATVQGIYNYYTGAAFHLFNDVNITLQTGDRTVFYVGTRTLQNQNSYLYNTNPAVNGVLQSNNAIDNFAYADNPNSVFEPYNVNVGLERNVVVSALKGGTSLLLKHNGDIKFSGATNSSSNSNINILGGDDSGLSGFYQYYMNVFIFYDRLLSDEEIKEVEDYLGDKYGVFIGNLFDFQTNPVNFQQVELDAIGIDKPNALISSHNDSLDITFSNAPNFTISGITSPHTLPASGTSAFNVQYSIPFSTLGLKTEQITFIPNTGNNKTLIINIEVILFAPTNLNGVSYFSKGYLSWLDGSVEADVDGFIIERDSGTGFVQIGTSTTTNFVDNNVNVGQNYNYRVKAFVSSGDSPYSNIFNLTISDAILPDFCTLENPYTITNESGCNTLDGVISITDYFIYNFFYVFELKNAQGQIFNHDSNGVYSNLSANYYSLKATPISSTFRGTCIFNWIIIGDASPYFITGETIQNAVCGSFNIQLGTAIIETNMIDGYNYWFYNQNGSLRETDNNIGSLTLKNLQSGDYYLYIENIADGCSIFYTFNISEDNILSVPNIKEIYISKWNENLDWNYWDSGNLFNSSAQSLKINEYLNYNQWYSIIVDEQNVSFSQKLSKARQGLTFDDVLTIGIPYHDSAKWNALKQVLEDRWVVVFKDANDNWWTFGFKHGAQAEDYTFGSELAGFTLGFKAISDDKIITAIDKSFVINNIK